MTEKELGPMEVFQERVRNKIRDDFASLIPENALDEMVKRAIDDAFFKERAVVIEGRNGWSNDRKILPPLLVEIAQNEAYKIFQSAVEKWVKENSDTVEAKLKEVFEKSAGEVLLRSFSRLFENSLHNVQSLIQNDLLKITQIR
jgi:hypothetical protein